MARTHRIAEHGGLDEMLAFVGEHVLHGEIEDAGLREAMATLAVDAAATGAPGADGDANGHTARLRGHAAAGSAEDVDGERGNRVGPDAAMWAQQPFVGRPKPKVAHVAHTPGRPLTNLRQAASWQEEVFGTVCDLCAEQIGIVPNVFDSVVLDFERWFRAASPDVAAKQLAGRLPL